MHQPWRLTFCLLISPVYIKAFLILPSLPVYRCFPVRVVSDSCKPFQDEISHMYYFSLRFTATETVVSRSLFFRWIFLHFLFDAKRLCLRRIESGCKSHELGWNKSFWEESSAVFVDMQTGLNHFFFFFVLGCEQI